MSSPRIFISYSAKEPAGEQLRDELARRLREAGYLVLLDKDELRLSQDWRSTLNAWIGGCDAAVLLLSEAALKSSYVAYEVSLLSYRHASEQGRFKLIPVYLPPVTMEQVDGSPLAPARVADVQSIRADVPQGEAIQRILDHLVAHVPSQSVADWHTRRLGGVLAKVQPGELESAVLRMGSPLEPWTPGMELPMRVALGLMAAGLEKATLGVRVFRSRLQGIAAIEEVMTLIATSWVDCRSAAEIGKCEEKSGLLALNGDDSRTAWLYVVRSFDMPLGDSWRVAMVDGVVGDGGLDELIRMVRTALAYKLNVPPEKVDETVRNITECREPVFVAVRLSVLMLPALAKLRAEFPGVTFFLLTGGEQLSEELARQAGITMLHPLLEPGIEQPFWLLYDKKLTYLKHL
ncbi:toll/interleukin-1 receptor domain-containing protein [Pyxidicoccus parkwayensis]|uniref:Toll/interleukin-1 receptor domain-containing protein n=1 Tax=Pyxidicoccus parkwayensis TaxID=2813578 RepID=A0ABX7NZ94_9BACT|nr:toll/interleukin-1 receptor domain-containing protein [Pyxidicoccus parkwaysis]QSQ24125.1 toll/interleukin-1 receptor domain-containing protein [Pyxidicoccus parkwaysis]